MSGVTNEAVLERAMRLPGPNFPAGSRYVYGGTGYTLLALIVAAVSGQSTAAFLKTAIFDPLGMKHTVAYDVSRPPLHKLAHAYWEEEGRFERWDYPLLTVGDGGLFSTLDDLFLWDQALNTERLVSQATLERAFTSGTTNDGTPVDYGFGWYTSVAPAPRHVAHGGTLVAYCNYIIRYLDTQRTIIILTNRGPVPREWQPGAIRGPRPRALEIAKILFGH
jgi:CubicO group peptidase (beta-lactamase class C family)